jgi:hypothetical protein
MELTEELTEQTKTGEGVLRSIVSILFIRHSAKSEYGVRYRERSPRTTEDAVTVRNSTHVRQYPKEVMKEYTKTHKILIEIKAEIIIFQSNAEVSKATQKHPKQLRIYIPNQLRIIPIVRIEHTQY